MTFFNSLQISRSWTTPENPVAADVYIYKYLENTLTVFGFWTVV